MPHRSILALLVAAAAAAAAAVTVLSARGARGSVGATTCAPAVRAMRTLDIGLHHAVAITSFGSVRGWGYNADGRLGLGHRSVVGAGMRMSPAAAGDMRLPSGERAVSVAAGNNHTLVLTTRDHVYAYGSASRGRLGYNDSTPFDRLGDPAQPPVPLPPGNIISIAAADHSCAAYLSNTLYCWGPTGTGALGYDYVVKYGGGTPPPYVVGSDISAVPLPDIDGPGRPPTLVGVAAGDGRTCVWTRNGNAACWGNDDDGALGSGGGDGGKPANAVGRLPMPHTHIIRGMDSGTDVTCAIVADISGSGGNDLYCWGAARRNLHAIAVSNCSDGLVNARRGVISKIAVGTRGVCVLDTDEQVVCGGESRGSGWLSTGGTNTDVLEMVLAGKANIDFGAPPTSSTRSYRRRCNRRRCAV